MPYLGFEVDSIRQAFQLLDDKKQKFIMLTESILSSTNVDVKMTCVAFAFVVPRLFVNEIHSFLEVHALLARLRLLAH